MRQAIVRLLIPITLGVPLFVQAQGVQQQVERWNRVFRSPEPSFTPEPNSFLMKSVQGKTPGKALEIGMGQGRNTIAMARLGWDVTGIDISDEGIRQAETEAKKQNLTIHAILADANKFDYGIARYDLIYATFEHQIVTNNADKIVPALKPGGLVIIEGFEEDFSREISRPLGYRVNELTRAFDKLRILYYEDAVGPADWNNGKPAPIARFIGRKPEN